MISVVDGRGESFQQLTPDGMLKVVTVPTRPTTTQNPPSWAAKQKESLAQPVPRSRCGRPSRSRYHMERTTRPQIRENPGTARTAGSARNRPWTSSTRQSAHTARNVRPVGPKGSGSAEDSLCPVLGSASRFPRDLDRIYSSFTRTCRSGSKLNTGAIFSSLPSIEHTTPRPTLPRMGLT